MRDNLYWNTMDAKTRQTFELLASLPVPDAFYLAGGTALALQIGHRMSADLDFFSSENVLGTVERSLLSRTLQQLDAVAIRLETEGQLYTAVADVESSFIYQPHPLISPSVDVQGVHLASPIDIGLMKLAAIKERGARRDFVDLYCLRHIAPLEMLFELLPQKYADRPDFSVHLAYALSYFDDAEVDLYQLKMIKDVDWEDVKGYCLAGARLLAKINVGLEPSS
jgi:hypothetical protein